MAFRISRTWIVLGLAVAIGGAAAVFSQRYMKSQIDEIEARGKGVTVKLVVPKENLPKGTPLDFEKLASRDVPKEWVHSNAITADQFSRAEGSLLAMPALRGEPLLWSQLEGHRTATFSARLAPGHRAVTVPVDEISSVSGLVEPGDLIDLFVTVRKDSKQFAFVLLQSVPVLAAGTKVEVVQTEGHRRTFSAITLDVTPEDARRVIAAREIGKVTALLRSPGDKTPVSTDRAEAAQLLGLIAPLQARLAVRSSVPVIYGGGPLTKVAPLDAQPASVPAPAPRAAAVVAAATP